MLEIEHVGVRFGGVRALGDVSLTVRAREIVGLVGPNGAGKTTLFDVISGVLRPHAGRLRLDRVDITAMPPYARTRRGIGRTFQIPQPMHSLTVAQNLHVAQRFGAGRADRCELDDIVELVGLAGKAHRDAATGLSLTELKALEIGKALATRPRLLLLDEVLAGLEAQGKRRFTQLLSDVHARYEVAIVMIEHDIEAISTLCPRVAVLDFGELIADGTPSEVFDDPAVVASYTGTAARA